jgi:hypothetical protein
VNSQAVLAQFAGAKIQLDNPQKEPPAELMGFFQREKSSWERECTTKERNSRREYLPASLL